MDYDVAIVGAGPAGGLAAHRLASAGARVVLLERERLPRYKTCGGGIVGRAAALLPFDPAVVTQRGCTRAEIHGPWLGGALVCERAGPVIRMTMRDELDARLAQAAAGAGAELRDGCALRSLERDGSGVRLQTSAGSLRARTVIGADGATGRVAALGGWKRRAAGAPALEAELAADDAAFERLAGAARFDFGVIPRGYGWVFPKRELLSVGVFSAVRGRVALREHLDAYMGRLGLGTARSLRLQGYVIPLHPVWPPARGAVLLAGDAAGVADPLTAEGISGALLTGRLAAEAILAGGPDGGQAARLYAASLRRSVLPGLRLARVVAMVAYGPARIRDGLLARFGTSMAQALLRVFTGESTYSALLRDPRSYLRALARSGPRA